jgi:WD40 repeat protein
LLWVSCYDGTVRSYDISQWDNEGNSSQENLYPPQKPLYRTDFTDSVLDMHLCDELKIGVCATSDGGAALFSLEDGQFFVGIMLFETAARSVTIVKHDFGEVNVDMDGNREHVSGYSVLCGGSDGTIHRIPLNVDSDKKLDMNDPFVVTDESDTSIRPRHVGPVMCLTSPGDGIFVSGGQDGALRVWKIGGMDNSDDDKEPNPEQQEKTPTLCKCMYALTGYKLWLGSALTDGDRLVSDGGENNIIVRDFSWKSDHGFWSR